MHEINNENFNIFFPNWDVNSEKPPPANPDLSAGAFTFAEGWTPLVQVSIKSFNISYKTYHVKMRRKKLFQIFENILRDTFSVLQKHP
jgi:hypothetical protein